MKQPFQVVVSKRHNDEVEIEIVEVATCLEYIDPEYDRAVKEAKSNTAKDGIDRTVQVVQVLRQTEVYKPPYKQF